MALVLKISKDSISSDGLTMVIKDTTGNYDATTDPNGYGAPNPARNTLALILRVNNKRYDGETTTQDTLLVLATYDPLTVTTWSCTLNKDGWQQAIVYGLRFYDVATSLQVGEIVYNVATSELWQILTKSGSGPYTYTHQVVTEAALADDSLIKAYQTILNTYAMPTLCKCLISANEHAIATQEDSDFATYLKIDSYLKSIRNSFCIGSPATGQQKVEQAEKICTCFTNECNC